MIVIKFLSVVCQWRFWPAYIAWFLSMATLIVPILTNLSFWQKKLKINRTKHHFWNLWCINGYFFLNFATQLIYLLEAEIFLIAWLIVWHLDAEGIVAVSDVLGEYGAFWEHYSWWCLLLMALSLMYFWSIYAKRGHALWIKYPRKMLCWQTGLFLVCACFSFVVIQINNLYWSEGGAALTNPVHAIYEVRADLARGNTLPTNKQELVKKYPQLEPLAFYGQWCYFPQLEENKFHLVAHYFDIWFITDDDGYISQTQVPSESQWRELIDECIEENQK